MKLFFLFYHNYHHYHFYRVRNFYQLWKSSSVRQESKNFRSSSRMGDRTRNSYRPSLLPFGKFRQTYSPFLCFSLSFLRILFILFKQIFFTIIDIVSGDSSIRNTFWYFLSFNPSNTSPCYHLTLILDQIISRFLSPTFLICLHSNLFFSTINKSSPSERVKHYFDLNCLALQMQFYLLILDGGTHIYIYTHTQGNGWHKARFALPFIWRHRPWCSSTSFIFNIITIDIIIIISPL